MRVDKVATTITSDNVTIKDNSYVVWTAGSSIEMTNFEVEEGSYFFAEIEACLYVGPFCGGSGRLANPNSNVDDTISNKYSNLRVVYYNTPSPVSKETIQEQSSKNKKPEDFAIKTNKEELPLLFPNPSSSGKFTFSGNNSQLLNSDVTVYNLLGEKIFQSENRPKSEIDISSHPKGIYFVKLSNGEEISVQKIVYE